MSQSTHSLTALAAHLHQHYPEEWVRAIAHERCRHLVLELESASYPIKASELASRLADRGDHPTTQNSHPRDLLIQMYHNDLPRLEAAGLIDYTYRSGWIEDASVNADIPLVGPGRRADDNN